MEQQHQLGGPSGKTSPVAEIQQQQSGGPPINYGKMVGLLDAALAEKERYAGIVRKLEVKLRPMSVELAELRTEVQELKQSQQEAKNAQEEYETSLERLTLDREVALESNDKLLLEVEELEIKVDELEFAAEVVTQEKVLEIKGFEDKHDPRHILFLQAENERLREALLTLRDITRRDKDDREEHLVELEHEVCKLPTVRAENLELHQLLDNAELANKHLKAQLENYEDNESLILDIQAKVQADADKIIELEAFIETVHETEEINEKIIADLEDAQRGIQAELDHQKALTQDATERILAYQHTVASQDDTVGKYRILVSNLHSDLGEAQGAHQTSQQEKAVAERRAQDLQDLAKETQQSAARTQRRDFDEEVTKLQLKLAQKELDIVQTYLLTSYDIVSEAARSLLAMTSINGKVKVLKLILEKRTQDSFTTDHDINKLIRLSLISRLGYFDLITEQLDEFISKAPLPTFITFGKSYYEFQHMDSQIDIWIDGLFIDSLVETDIMRQAETWVWFFDNIAEDIMPENPQSVGSSPHCPLDYGRKVDHIGHDLDNVTILVHYLQEMFTKYVKLDSEANEHDQDLYKQHQVTLNNILSTIFDIHVQERSMEERWIELKDRSMTVDTQAEQKIFLCRQSLAEAFTITYKHTLDFSNLVTEERDHELTVSDLGSVVGDTPYQQLSYKLIECYKHIKVAKDLMDTPDCLIEVVNDSFEHPWITHNLMITTEDIAYREVIRQLTTAKSELTERANANALSEKMIQELKCNIEVLYKRINDSVVKNDRLIDLEKALDESLVDTFLYKTQRDTAEERLQQVSAERQRTVTNPDDFPSKIPRLSQPPQDILVLKRQVRNLESTVRDVHMASHSQRSTSTSTIHWE